MQQSHVTIVLLTMLVSFVSPFTLAEACPGKSKSSKTPPRFLVIGHRGAPGWLPEHTLASYSLAIRKGADYIEPDLVSTKDGVLIARHENELSQTTDVAKKFPKRKTTKIIDGRKVTGWFSEDFTLKEIKTLRAKQSMPFRTKVHNGKYDIPTFREILGLVQELNCSQGREIGVYPETKHPSYFRSIGLPLEDKLLKELKNADMNHSKARVFIQSFEVSNLQYLRSKTKVKLIQLLYTKKYKPYDFVVSKDKRTYGDLMTDKGLKFVASYADGIGPWKGLILPKGRKATSLTSTGLIDRAHKHKLLVHAYTFRDEALFLSPLFKKNPTAEYHFFMSLGLDGMFSDFPGTARKAVDTYKVKRRKHPIRRSPTSQRSKATP
ncbi:MAG: glycerophosphodiester phosphodiesterase [Deltaproteobacteria bacterium]|nr:MAG: glycerophosphodiester phosphodiesterase [Deltaproteobacteria bacterium]